MKNISIRFLIIASFSIIMFFALFIISFITYSNWINSTNKLILRESNNANKNITNKIEEFVNIPIQLNNVNHNIIEKGIVNINNKSEREHYFAGVLISSKPEIYSFSIGTEIGEYYGARRNEKNQIEVMENNALTNNKTRYYSITDELTAGKFSFETSQFDPRTRDWYIAGKESKEIAFSPIYKHFVMNDLAISAACPIYSKNGKLFGVLGTHMTLSSINKYLEDISKNPNIKSFIVERKTGYIIANSIGMQNFKNINSDFKRIPIKDVKDKTFIEAYKKYITDSNGNFVIKTNSDNLYMNVTSFKLNNLDWLIITAIPEGQFSDNIVQSIFLSILMSIFALLLAILLYRKTTAYVLRPIYELIDVTEKFSKGDFSIKQKVYRNDEIGKLSVTFNNMADKLQKLIFKLEDEVSLQTKELQEANLKLKQAKENAEFLATHDFLTGLPNRVLLINKIEKAIEFADKSSSTFCVMSMDLDKFKAINDTFGHGVGDNVLKEIAAKLSDIIGENNIVSRFGGDEFVLLSTEVNSFDDAEVLANKMIKIFEQPFESFDNNTTQANVSIGIAFYPAHGKTPTDLIKNSDQALYKAKRKGGKNFEIVDISEIT